MTHLSVQEAAARRDITDTTRADARNTLDSRHRQIAAIHALVANCATPDANEFEVATVHVVEAMFLAGELLADAERAGAALFEPTAARH